MAKPAKMTAFLGRSKRLGQWQVPGKSTVFALFGTCYLDMRKAYTAKDTEIVKMSVTSIFGSVEIVVPDGVEVQPSGAAFLASSNFEVPKLREDATLPPIVLESLTLFGRLRLHTLVDEVEAAARDAELARIAEEERLAEEEAARAAAEAAAAKAEADRIKAEEKAAADAKKAAEEAAEKKAAKEAAIKAAEEAAAAEAAGDEDSAADDDDESNRRAEDKEEAAAAA